MKKYILILIFSFFVTSVYAHPHVWVYSKSGLNVNNGKLESISVNWEFDEMYSATFMLDADINGDKIFDKKEKQQIEDSIKLDIYENLSNFILINLDGKEIKDYYFSKLDINYDKEKEVVLYNFNLVLKNSYNIKGHHKIAFLDYEYYIGFEQNMNLDLKNASMCKAILEEDTSIEIFGGMMNPEVYEINCK